ncbi:MULTISPECIES: hypothetical protein [unclassified Streptomyces]|uniref:hypothetical protein n=1 Tax=unclassified Streptomyces TaxID=2593676 RepID=UPI002E81FFC7|nr:hypothetical protein [Streptomyces sp. NBC_00589]WTI34972.1 hypothetical protein OIC96_08185 [Streptomyces sp. NBC_00775]WUB31354.1 hypothetical protein OHA51_41545 [Streptomyces sp. NBC_00589]
MSITNDRPAAATSDQTGPAVATAEQIRRAPKVLLHDHLDGGVRPATVLALARETGYDALPKSDAAELGAWFREAADSGSLERYLETFSHTVGVMQTREALVRVAAECAEDLAADGVVYAEVKHAPELHTAKGLTLDEVVQAVLEGFREGERRAAAAGHRIRIGALVTAMRHAAGSREIAELVNKYRDVGVVGFDIAGAEDGFPPTRHLAEAHSVPGGAGTLMALSALGALLGAVTHGALGWAAAARDKAVLLAAGMAATYWLVALVPGPAGACLVAVGTGVFFAPLLTVAFGLVGELAPEGTVTEAFAWLVTLIGGGIAAGSAVAGLLLAGSTLTAAAAAGACGVTAGALVLAFARGGLAANHPAGEASRVS